MLLVWVLWALTLPLTENEGANHPFLLTVALADALVSELSLSLCLTSISNITLTSST